MFIRTTITDEELVALMHLPDRLLTIHLLKEMQAMALDLTKLNAAIERSVKASEALVAAHTDPAAQAAADLAADTLNTESAKVEAAIVPVPPVA